MKIRSVGAGCSMRTDRHTEERRQTDMTKLRVAFINFSNAPKEEKTKYLYSLRNPLVCDL
jgi:hypothetical protein